MTGPANVRAKIVHRGRVVGYLASVDLAAAGWVNFNWDGKNGHGRMVRFQSCHLVIQASDSNGQSARAGAAIHLTH